MGNTKYLYLLILIAGAAAPAAHEGRAPAEAAPACAGADQFKQKDAQLRRAMAVTQATGRHEAAKLRAVSLARKAKRMEALMKSRSITPAAYRAAAKDSKLADVARDEAAVQVELAKAEEALAVEEAKCRSGESPDTKGIEKVYAGIFRNRVKLAELAVRRAKVNLEDQREDTRSITALAKSGSIDEAIVAESTGLLDAAQAEVTAAESALRQAREAAGIR